MHSFFFLFFFFFFFLNFFLKVVSAQAYWEPHPIWLNVFPFIFCFACDCGIVGKQTIEINTGISRSKMAIISAGKTSCLSAIILLGHSFSICLHVFLSVIFYAQTMSAFTIVYIYIYGGVKFVEKLSRLMMELSTWYSFLSMFWISLC